MMVLQLNKEIYDIVYVRAGCRAFSELARIRIDDGNASWNCVLTGCVHDAERTARELENYIIDLQNTGRS